MGGVHLIRSSHLDVKEDSVEEELEVVNSSLATIQIVRSSNREEVRDMRSDFPKNFLCLGIGDSWDLFPALQISNICLWSSAKWR